MPIKQRPRERSNRIFPELSLAPLILIALTSLPALARTVDSTEDQVRLQGYDDYIKEKQAWERERLSDRGESRSEDAQWNQQRRLGKPEDQLEKRTESEDVNERGPEYKEYVKERLEEAHEDKLTKQDYIAERNWTRKIEARRIDLSEAQELKLSSNTARVEWSKRKFFPNPNGAKPTDASSSNSNSQSNPSDYGSPYNSYSQPPPPPYFDGYP